MESCSSSAPDINPSPTQQSPEQPDYTNLGQPSSWTESPSTQLAAGTYTTPIPGPSPQLLNPKDAAARQGGRVRLGLLPAAGIVYGACAMEEGARKYGPYNWRTIPVRFDVYLDAMERHILRLRDGEWADAEGFPHLGAIIAAAAICADANETGNLSYVDMPPPGPASALLDNPPRKCDKEKGGT